MERVITVQDCDGGDVQVRLKATGAIPRLYRIKFNRDAIQDMAKLQKMEVRRARAELALAKARETLAAATKSEDGDAVRSAAAAVDAAEEAFSDAQFANTDLEVFENMAYIMARHADPDVPVSVEEWMEGFGTFAIQSVLPEMMELWMLNTETLSTSKKNLAKLTAK